MIACRVILTTVLFSISSLLLNGCSTLGYYSQSIAGQSEIILKRQPIDTVLRDRSLTAQTRQRLQLVDELRRFSIAQLGLPDNASYTSYADLERPYVVWNIFATEEFSLTPRKWCFLIVGCLDYRGYFNEEDARLEKLRLEQSGYDVFLGGVAAYSTLGWFDDPVLNTMLAWSETWLAKVMFHELAHQQLYVKNDTAFNESYADAVAMIGVRQWLEQKNDVSALQDFIDEQARETQFIELAMKYRHSLAELYRSGLDETAMRNEKQRLYELMKAEYRELKKSWAKGSYDNWFNSQLNNAKLASVVSYRTFVDDMLAIYENLDGKLSLFYDIIKAVSLCDYQTRRMLLKNRSTLVEC